MVVLDIVKTKAEPLPVIRQSESVLAAVRKMLELKESGLLIMTPGGDPVGIITEKDVMRLVAERYTQLDKVEVWEVMSKQLLTVPHTTLLDEALKLMTDKHIHHLPVMQDKKPVGLITLDDIIAAQLRRTEAEARALKDFIALQ
jgi:signal-transduction protein with cAMP-binding, CBS, and nucleotidyltransferase domain